MTQEQAQKEFDSNWWDGKSNLEIAHKQINEERLICPFNVFQRAVERIMGERYTAIAFTGPNVKHMRREINRVYREIHG